ncbi:MAG: Gfo/Idh/MocA family oxidoreductase [Myxococcales bacterium]|nr:Gfo/Idh/MocA family oxidoreductase [Myxococcales bacterium]
MTRTLVVGLGSIGSRHARVLAELGCDVAAVSARAHAALATYPTIEAALRDFEASYVVIASETHAHRRDLGALAALGFSGTVLVEKPLFADAAAALPEGLDAEQVFVGYDLRFHPLLVEVERLLDDLAPRAAHLAVGQHLPGWRPERDYRAVYSASRARGGGVLRDLSHELDVACWLFGAPRRLTARGGHHSALQIDSDDSYALLIEHERCPLVTVQLDYLDHQPRRTLRVLADETTIAVDLVGGELAVYRDGVRTHAQRVALAPDDVYIAEHRALLGAADDERLPCSAADALRVMRVIGAAERAAVEATWVAL